MSKRYIDADDLFEALNRTHQKAMAGFDWVRVAEVMQTISRVPTADVVEREHGLWKISCLPRGKLQYCSQCGFGKHMDDERTYNFCPLCGAMMERSEDDEAD